MYAATTAKRPSFFETSFFKTYNFVTFYYCSKLCYQQKVGREANVLAIKGSNIQGADI